MFGWLGRVLLLALFAFAFASACDLPRDPERTYHRARGSVLRVGVTERPPWIQRAPTGDAAPPQGIEAELIAGFARQLDARIDWTWGSEQQLLEALERFELDLAAGGFTRNTPWKNRVALTQVYVEREQPVTERGDATTQRERHVLAVAPGENRTLYELDRYLLGQGSSLAEKIGEAP